MYSIIFEGTNKVHIIQKSGNNKIYLLSFSFLNMCGPKAFSDSACELSPPAVCSVEDRALPVTNSNVQIQLKYTGILTYNYMYFL